ncbi:SDR family NAD(P)-dependent oxidoreductase [Frigidibacter sp. SD6-1]|uniref:SDR family NAD(P)-dependent oxidoreductase n=1 Tax=Frigidibacter sp. SD6-1 TaxID=3032581 RepID=UPI0024DFE41A|nr:SDR family NAD(P)-dependent oxidoreductase [Frigidibacter sp. SD6-1]
MFGMESNRFFGRKVLVTAAATPLGRALALGLARRGADVLAIDRDMAGLSDLAWDCAGAVQTGTGDATIPEEAAVIASWIRSDHASLAGLIACPNAAGQAPSSQLLQRLTRLLRGNPDPFAGVVLPDGTAELSGLGEGHAPAEPRFGITRIILPPGSGDCDHPAMADAALRAINARAAVVHLAARRPSRRRSALNRILVRAAA